jgi:hypothetical protein
MAAGVAGVAGGGGVAIRFPVDSIHRPSCSAHPRMAWIYRVDQGRHPPEQNAVPTDRRMGPVAGAWRMDAAAKPRDGLQRPRDRTHPPSHRKPAFDVAVEVAGQRPALPRVPGATRPTPPTRTISGCL